MTKNHRYSRREFLTDASLLGIGAASLPILSAFAKSHTYYSPGTGLDLAVAKNGTPSTNTERAIQALGSMERFVKPGDHVVLKVNCVSAFSPEYAVNTHPDVIATVIRLCLASGAKASPRLPTTKPPIIPAAASATPSFAPEVNGKS